MSSPEGWKKTKKKRRSVKSYSDEEVIARWKNTESKLRKKASDERMNNLGNYDEELRLGHELYGTPEQAEQNYDVHGYDTTRVPVITIEKIVSEEHGTWYSVMLKTPFYDFDRYNEGHELYQTDNFNRAKRYTVGFMKAVPTVTLADAMILDPHIRSYDAYLTDEQMDRANLSFEDWRDDIEWRY